MNERLNLPPLASLPEEHKGMSDVYVQYSGQWLLSGGHAHRVYMPWQEEPRVLTFEVRDLKDISLD